MTIALGSNCYWRGVPRAGILASGSTARPMAKSRLAIRALKPGETLKKLVQDESIGLLKACSGSARPCTRRLMPPPRSVTGRR
jgi:hypothetical protein